MSYYPQSSRSPPPLHHPQPTHPHYEIPEPPGTPSEPGSYRRFTSSPAPAAYAQPTTQRIPNAPRADHGYGPQYQSFSTPQTVPGQQPMVPNMAAWGVNDVTAQMGMQFGRSAVTAGQDYVEKNLNAYLPVALLKHQFNVSNSYVLRKLGLVLFPWRHRPWARQVRKADATGQADTWQPPREDINSPDLYIPSMAIVTYIMLAALNAGLKKRFNPEILAVTASTAFASVLVDFLIIQLGCYLLAISGQGQVVDIFAYCGYKFEGIIVTFLVELVGLPSMVWSVVFLYTCAATFFFTLRSLRYVVLPDPTRSSVANSQTVTSSQRSARVKFLFVVAALQTVYMWFLRIV